MLLFMHVNKRLQSGATLQYHAGPRAHLGAVPHLYIMPLDCCTLHSSLQSMTGCCQSRSWIHGGSGYLLFLFPVWDQRPVSIFGSDSFARNKLLTLSVFFFFSFFLFSTHRSNNQTLTGFAAYKQPTNNTEYKISTLS